MSIGKLSDAGHLGEAFKGLTLEEFKKKAEETFWMTYGRYENASGKMYCELEHNGADDNHEAGSVKWRKGVTGGKVLEDEVLERPQAIGKFFRMVDKGYSLVFNAITSADFETKRLEQVETFSPMKREGLLGEYIKGSESFRVNEYGGLYSVERLFDGMITGGKHELTEADARAELELALEEGFVREGADEPESSFDPFAAWRVDDVADEDAEKDSGTDADVPDMSALLKAFDD